MLLLKGILVSFLIQLAYCFPDGASTAACMSMTPGHGLNQPQTTPTPYSVTPNIRTVRPGEIVMITIARTNNSVVVRGFLIQARNTADEVVGQFLLTTGMRLMNCITLPAGSVATHSSPDQRESIILAWTPPAGFVGDVVFHVTVVNMFTTFWTGIVSPTVTVTA